MPILTEDIKLMASQRLSDTTDGGGRMTGNEIVDGNVNNLYPDISRLDRVYGRVSLRKGFAAVQANNAEVYSGAHVILSVPTKDPRVSVCMFTTGDPHDTRAAARDRLESYVTEGPRYQGWLWGDQPAGSRSLLIFQVKGYSTTDVGGVLCLYKDKGLGTEQKQFVRVTKVEITRAEFNTTSSSSEYGSVAMGFSRDIVRLEIGDPLRFTVPGIEISKNDALPTNIYTTIVSDASKYYGVMLPTEELTAGQIEINVDSIFTHLVPSAQGESPMVDLSVGEAGPVVGVGQPYILNVTAFNGINGAQLHFGRGIAINSLTIVAGARTFRDDSSGYLTEGTSQVGTVDYSTGTVTFTNISPTFTANLVVTATVAVEVPRVPNTMFKNVDISNRGYSYTAILSPLPVPKSVWVDYMAQGKWYRLRDNGKGVLVPDIANTGTGTINYATGNLVLTCGALPDVDTAILYNWANPVECFDLSGEVEVNIADIEGTLAHHPVQPGSFSVTWPTGVSSTGTATDNGSGVITGNATGYINYNTGEYVFRPTLLPVADGEYTIDYQKYAKQEGVVAVTGTGICTLTLPSGPIKPGTVAINAVVQFGAYPHVYPLRDDGAGNLSAPLWGLDFPVSHPTWPGKTVGNGITGSIDYVSGVCTIDVSGVEGFEHWLEPYSYQVCPSASAQIPPITWPTPATLPELPTYTAPGWAGGSYYWRPSY